MKPRCVRRVRDYGFDGFRSCRRPAVVEYRTDPDGGLREQPAAYLCERHRRPAPDGYLVWSVRA